jgi:hypothetical protein
MDGIEEPYAANLAVKATFHSLHHIDRSGYHIYPRERGENFIATVPQRSYRLVLKSITPVS